MTMTDHDDRVRFAGVMALLLLACGLSLAISFVWFFLVLQHAARLPAVERQAPASISLDAGAARQVAP